MVRIWFELWVKVRLSVGAIQTYLILLCYILFHRFFFSFIFLKNQLKVYDQSAFSKSIYTILPIAFAHFVVLFHILAILAIQQTFVLLLYCYSNLRSVIFEVLVIVLGSTNQFHIRRQTYLKHVVCVLTALSTGHFPFSLPLLHLLCSLRHNIEIKPINNFTMGDGILQCSSEREICMSHFKLS